jgi:hypothetical protein
MAVKSKKSPIPVITEDGGDDPIIIKSGGVEAQNGAAEEDWVTITLDTEENMGWKIVKGKGVIAIIISEETSAWKVKTDNKKKICLERPGKAITKMNVANMVDEHEDDVPRMQMTKQEKYPAIQIHYGE